MGPGSAAHHRACARAARCPASGARSSAENSAATASIAGAAEAFEVAKSRVFVGFFTMARRLLILQPESKRPRHAAFVGVLPCCLLLAPYRPHWMCCSR